MLVLLLLVVVFLCVEQAGPQYWMQAQSGLFGEKRGEYRPPCCRAVLPTE